MSKKVSMWKGSWVMGGKQGDGGSPATRGSMNGTRQGGSTKLEKRKEERKKSPSGATLREDDRWEG